MSIFMYSQIQSELFLLFKAPCRGSSGTLFIVLHGQTQCFCSVALQTFVNIWSRYGLVSVKSTLCRLKIKCGNKETTGQVVVCLVLNCDFNVSNIAVKHTCPKTLSKQGLSKTTKRDTEHFYYSLYIIMLLYSLVFTLMVPQVCVWIYCDTSVLTTTHFKWRTWSDS